MQNPFSEKYIVEEDESLVKKSLDGDRKALDLLIQKHQPFIYNVAWKMAHDPSDAMDLTQETLLKVITKLSQFSFKSSFRTWLYRIVFNEFLQSKRRKGEEQFSTFEAMGEQLDALPNPDLTIEEEIEQKELIKEMRLRCMSGMLMCLSREQRLIYVLGDSFGIDHKMGAEIFELSPQNFRVKLHRARKELYNYMNNKCGLVKKDNPCRCSKKAKALKELGFLDEATMQFNKSYKKKIADHVVAHHDEVADQFEEKYQELFRDHPVKTEFSKESIIDNVLNDDDLLKHFNVN